MAEHETEFSIAGVDSDQDRERIETELHAMEGVSGTEWTAGGDALHVRFDYDLLAAAELERAVRDVGYAVDDDA